jgi:hypothetical protein
MKHNHDINFPLCELDIRTKSVKHKHKKQKNKIALETEYT